MVRGGQQKNTRVQWTLLISLLLHVGALFLQISSVPPELPTSPTDSLIELSEIPPNMKFPPAIQARETPKNQVVETEDAHNRDIDPNATLLSDRNQKADKATKAAVTDNFISGKGNGQGPSTNEEAGGESQDSISLGVNGPKKDWKTLSLKDLSVGNGEGPLSASDDYLPHVETGERTILSTREFRYFSYYNRMKDLLRQFWKPSIEREVAKLWGKGQMLKENELTTRVLVLLDKQGHIQKISKVGASGISEIDEAAVKAFYQAAPFPNPPAGLVDTDGFVRINWDFILQTAAAPRIQYRPSGPRGFR